MITAARWLEVLTYCGVRAPIAAAWAPKFEAYIQPDRFSLGLREIDDFVGQVLHETARLERLVEGLSYTAERLCQVWPTRFPSLGVARQFEHSPTALAERVYGGRMGNDKPGDGFKYRGGGIPMITGKANYQLLQDLTGLPLVDKPELLREPDGALRCAVLWWEKKVPDSAIDTLERVTRAVNGGTVGLDDRRLLTDRARAKLQ